MRKLSWLVLAAVSALLVAGVAMAHRTENKGIAAVSTTFTAKPTSDTRSRSCTDATGAVWHLDHGVYQGTATGDLAGNVTIRTESVINTKTGFGFTQGKVLLRDASSNKLIGEANLEAVNTQSGVLEGLLEGRVTGGKLVANFSATFANDGSSLSGAVGGGGGSNSAIVYGGMPKCTQSTTTPPKPILRVEGKVTAASATSLTVSHDSKSWTIAVPSSLSAAAAALKTGDKV
ncbi:MAG TPA: hypothetical protein VLN26_01980, partial [Gaiellaceae bacterium]|nr:hypothetical protein [Gaiellaceae bacterium]